MSTVKVVIEGHLPSRDLPDLLQIIRGWEDGRTDIQLAIRVDSTEPIESAQEMMRKLLPELTHERVVRFRCPHCYRELP